MFENDPHKLITCILPKGIALDVVKKLSEEKGIKTGNVDSSRGMGKLTPLAYRGVGEQTEKEILNVVVTEIQADEIFEYTYEEAEINQPHGGIIYMTRLQKASPYILPDLPDEE